MKIRLAKVSDIHGLFAIGNAVGEFKVSKGTVTFWPKSILRKIITGRSSICLVAEEKKELVGFVIANYNPDFSKAIIENIFVKQSMRRSHVGRALLESVMNILKKKKCKYICAIVGADLTGSAQLYMNIGFSKGNNCIWLDKALSKEYSLGES